MKGSTVRRKNTRVAGRGSTKARGDSAEARVNEGACAARDAVDEEKPSRPRIGFHAGIAGGLQNALLKAQSLGADALQIFSRNPRGWKARPLEDEDVETFKRVRAEVGITPVVVHANYLINLAAADEGIREKSVASFREEVERCLRLGADYLVVHPGSARGACEPDGLRTCSESLNAACEGLELGEFRILLENTAGQGECIGHRFEHLREIAERCPGLNLGVCLDTAHAFTAGYDIRDEDGCAAAFDSLERNVGLSNVRAVHFNDSKAVYNSRVDRHFHISLGHIGAAALARVAREPRLAHAAFILETPQDELGDDARNLSMLRSFITTAPNLEETALMDIQLKDRSAGPHYLQIREQIEARIRDKQLSTGDALPSPASLAAKLSIDRGEVQRAYFELEHAGLVSKTVGKDFLGKEKVAYTVR
ncbi:MAG TPA: deoxyribonuclease IV [Pyrinomonadaceae bacterium]|nr:deoxyribonuclease IV [Pyrinomonadaceae bacterium]